MTYDATDTDADGVVEANTDNEKTTTDVLGNNERYASAYGGLQAAIDAANEGDKIIPDVETIDSQITIDKVLVIDGFAAENYARQEGVMLTSNITNGDSVIKIVDPGHNFGGLVLRGLKIWGNGSEGAAYEWGSGVTAYNQRMVQCHAFGVGGAGVKFSGTVFQSVFSQSRMGETGGHGWHLINDSNTSVRRNTYHQIWASNCGPASGGAGIYEDGSASTTSFEENWYIQPIVNQNDYGMVVAGGEGHTIHQVHAENNTTAGVLITRDNTGRGWCTSQLWGGFIRDCPDALISEGSVRASFHRVGTFSISGNDVVLTDDSSGNSTRGFAVGLPHANNATPYYSVNTDVASGTHPVGELYYVPNDGALPDPDTEVDLSGRVVWHGGDRQPYWADKNAGTPVWKNAMGKPKGSAPSYTVSNVTNDRLLDADSTTLDEVADVLGTLIGDLQSRGEIDF